MLADQGNCLHCCLWAVLHILVQQGIYAFMVLNVEMHTFGNNSIDCKITEGCWAGKFSLQQQQEGIPKQLCNIQVH